MTDVPSAGLPAGRGPKVRGGGDTDRVEVDCADTRQAVERITKLRR